MTARHWWNTVAAEVVEVVDPVLEGVALATERGLVRLQALAYTFPSLAKRLPNMGPALLGNLRKIAIDSGAGAVYAARFILSVYDASPQDAGTIALDLRKAWGSWDDAHRAAYQAWSASPWWC